MQKYFWKHIVHALVECSRIDQSSGNSQCSAFLPLEGGGEQGRQAREVNTSLFLGCPPEAEECGHFYSPCPWLESPATACLVSHSVVLWGWGSYTVLMCTEFETLQIGVASKHFKFGTLHMHVCLC